MIPQILWQESNLEVFKILQEEWGGFFYDYGDRLQVGRKIAGGQAEIFEAHVEYLDGNKVEYALKVFKESYSLRNLQKQWPQDLLQRIDGGGIFTKKDFSVLYDGTLMPNGRFAFRIQRCWGDLRRLTAVKMRLIASCLTSPEPCGTCTSSTYCTEILRPQMSSYFLTGRLGNY